MMVMSSQWISRRYNLAMSFRPLLVLGLALLAVPLQSQPAQPPSMLTALPTPAAPGSGEPQLSVSSRGMLLSWIERAGSRWQR